MLSEMCDLLPLQRLIDCDTSSGRYDEEEAERGEDDGTKRKKEFSELFKKQMDLRKVTHNLFFRNVLCFSYQKRNSVPCCVVSVYMCSPAAASGDV